MSRHTFHCPHLSSNFHSARSDARLSENIHLSTHILLPLAFSLLPLTSQGQTVGEMGLPVSEAEVCIDWYKAIASEGLVFDNEDEEVIIARYAPDQYIVTDLDHDGLPEVLVQDSQGIYGAILSYNEDNELKFVDASANGYITLGIGDGWYVRQHDDHMNEYRTWTVYYYRVANGKFEMVGYRETGFDGVDEDGEYIPREEDHTDGKAPDDNSIKMFYDLGRWTHFSEEAVKMAKEEIRNADLGYHEHDDDCDCDEPDPEYFAYEVTLTDGSRLRIDYMKDGSDYLSGYTTRYRKHGAVSRVPFFGTHFYDRLINIDFYKVFEHDNGKCCGHMMWSFNEAGEMHTGAWALGEKSQVFDAMKEVKPHSNVAYTRLAAEESLPDQLLPCSRDELKELYRKTYPEAGPAALFMLYDMDGDGVFEVFVQDNSSYTPSTALMWMQGGKMHAMGFPAGHKILLHLTAMYVSSPQGPALYGWKDGAPVDLKVTDPERLSFFEEYSQEMHCMGEWIVM